MFPTYLSQGQPYPYQQPVQQPVQQPGMIVRPVASIDEARAVQTDFSGATTIMPDFSHGFIYTKQMNFQTGNAEFIPYQRVQMQETKVPDLSDYVKRSDFDELAKRFNALLDQLGGTANGHGTNAHAEPNGE